MKSKASGALCFTKHMKTIPHFGLYMISQCIYVAIFIALWLESNKFAAILTGGLWAGVGMLEAGVDIWIDSSKPAPETALRAFLLTFFLPFHTFTLYCKHILQSNGPFQPTLDGLLFSLWRSILASTPVYIVFQGALLFSNWARFESLSLSVCLQLAFLALALVSLVASGAAYKITVRESDPIIWYKPMEENGRGGSFMDRLVQAVSSVLQVEYGATQPGSTSRLPVIEKRDQRMLIKKSGRPTLLYCPGLAEIGQHFPVAFLQASSRLISVTLMATYLHAYTLISITIALVLTVMASIKMMKMKPKNAVLSGVLSVFLPATSTTHSSPYPPIKTKYTLLNTIIVLVVNMVSISILLGTSHPHQDIPLPIFSCSHNSTLSRPCQENEAENTVLSLALLVAVVLGLLSLLIAFLSYKRSEGMLLVCLRRWSEKHRAYLDDDSFTGLGRKWRMANMVEVEDRKGSLLKHLQLKTVNVFRISNCQGLAVPHARLQDGVILPKSNFESGADIATLGTEEENFKSFDNLYGLRFTRYAIYIRDSY